MKVRFIQGYDAIQTIRERQRWIAEQQRREPSEIDWVFVVEAATFGLILSCALVALFI